MNTPIWDDRDWRPLPKLTGPQRADVCVIGLGASGLAAVEELVSQDVAVVGLDAFSVGAGAAGRNGGFVLAGLAKFFNETVAQFGEEAARTLYRLTAGEIERQAEDMPAIVRVTGSLRIAADADEKADCAKHLAALRYCGFAAEPYAGPEGEGLLLPTDGVIQPLHRVRAVAQRLRQREVRLYEDSAVRKIVPGSVVTDKGTVYCDSVIVAVDGRLEQVLPELAGRVRTARLQMLATAPAPEADFPRPVYYRQGYEYWQQLPDRSIALGGFRDHALGEEWTADDFPTERIQALQEKFLRQHLKVRAPITHRWAASVGYTPDGLPILEEVRPKIWAVGGYNGTGNIVGVLGARAAARLACGQTSAWAGALAKAREHARRAGREF
ncbi:FAD-binding oxidoreductase [Oleiharenicola lentus]|uniref:FAD-binding oxidoreductase n=1 Tax=Oleiharenicola lentus TaxID=2508720 RepID=A0A4Q1C4S3_9BACT|nr:FAD-binding oxidoreductase [Oleiharenicola lentus]RXK53428.1 FAD-binding oxidoreductase [Oleiharenicola lentus]